MIPIIKAISLGTGPALLVELKSGSFKKLQPQAKLESFPANSTFLGAPRPPFLLPAAPQTEAFLASVPGRS